MRKQVLALSVALACPLLAAAPSLAASFRSDAVRLLSKPERGEILVPSAQLDGARESALDYAALTRSFVHPRKAQLEPWRRNDVPSQPDVRTSFAGDALHTSDGEHATSVGYPESDWQSPPGHDAVPAVPEPAAALAFGLGAVIVAFAWTRTKRRNAAAAG